MEDQETMLRETLSDFLRKHSEEEAISGIDEIVMSYMVSVLEELGEDASAGEAFDLDGFIEMMDAYLPGFSNVNSAEVCEWVFVLAARLRRSGNAPKKPATALTQPVMIPQPKTAGSITNKATPSPPRRPGQQREVRRRHRSRKMSDQNEAELCSGAEASYVENVFHDNGVGVELLMEMFPAACSLELSHCLEVSDGHLEAAAQLILLRQETGESFKAAAPPKPHQPSAKKSNLSEKDSTILKKSIINRYSYVDVDESKMEHRPVMPKYEGKKLTRYLDNKVVSTKGEKFTEIKNAEEEEQRKKTTVNIKPAKQYRFH